MKFKQDFALETQEATCRPGNTWDEPTAWLDCRESMFPPIYRVTILV